MRSGNQPDLLQVEAKSLSALYEMYNKKMSPAAIEASEEFVNAGSKAKVQFRKMMEDAASQVAASAGNTADAIVAAARNAAA